MKKKQVESEEEKQQKSEELVEGKKRSKSVLERKKLKKQDRAARWSGFVLLLCLLIAGFLMWIYGEITNEQIQTEYRLITE